MARARKRVYRRAKPKSNVLSEAQIEQLNKIQAVALDCRAGMAGLKDLLNFDLEGDLLSSYHPNAYFSPVKGISRLSGRADAISRSVAVVLNNLRNLDTLTTALREE